MSNYYEASIGKDHFGLVTTQGFPHLFGKNDTFQLGHPDRDFVAKIGERAWVPQLTRTFLQVATGDGFTIFLDIKGDLFFLGLNDMGQGTSNIKTKYTMEITKISNQKFKCVKVHGKSVFAVCTSGALYVWGDNRKKLLGLGEDSTDIVHTPTIVPNITDVQYLSIGSNSVGLVSATPQYKSVMYVWGSNKSRKLHQGAPDIIYVPQHHSQTNITEKARIHIGESHVFFSLDGVSYAAQGSNKTGQITGTPSEIIYDGTSNIVSKVTDLHTFGDYTLIFETKGVFLCGSGSSRFNIKDLTNLDTVRMTILGGNSEFAIIEYTDIGVCKLTFKTLEIEFLYGKGNPLYSKQDLVDPHDFTIPKVRLREGAMVPIGNYILDNNSGNIYSSTRKEDYRFDNVKNVLHMGVNGYMSTNNVLYRYKEADDINSNIGRSIPLIDPIIDYGIGETEVYVTDKNTNVVYKGDEIISDLKAKYIHSRYGTVFLIKPDGTMWVKGDANKYGEYGLGNTKPVHTWTQIGNDTDWTKVMMNYDHSIAMKSDGTLWSCGRNNEGQLGVGNTIDKYTFTKIGNDNDWTDFSVGLNSSFGIKKNKALYGWGSNVYGQLGTGDTVSTPSPTLIDSASQDCVYITAGDKQSFLVKENGTLWITGEGTDQVSVSNKFKQHGIDNNWNYVRHISGDANIALKTDKTISYIGTPSDDDIGIIGNPKSDVFAPIKHKKSFKHPFKLNTSAFDVFPFRVTVMGTSNFSESIFAMNDNDELYAWGNNAFGQLGLGDAVDRKYPTLVTRELDFYKIYVGPHHTLAVQRDGTLWGWGLLPTPFGGDDHTFVLTPKKIAEDNPWAELSFSKKYSLGIKNDGTLWAWGSDNTFGQMGIGVVDISMTPIQVGIENTWKRVSTGEFHTVAIKEDGSLWSWGFNIYGQLGLGDRTYSAIPFRVGELNNWQEVECGDHFTVALQDNIIMSCGHGIDGELGSGTRINRRTFGPISGGGGKTWDSIHCGAYHTIARRSDGTIWSWGRNYLGQLGVGISDNDTTFPIQIGEGNDWKTVHATSFGSFATRGTTSPRLYSTGSSRTHALDSNTSVNSMARTPIGLPEDIELKDKNSSKIFKINTKGELFIKLKSDNKINPKEVVDYDEWTHIRTLDVINFYHTEDFENYPVLIVQDSYDGYLFIDDIYDIEGNINSVRTADVSIQWSDRVTLGEAEIRITDDGTLEIADYKSLTSLTAKHRTYRAVDGIKGARYIRVVDGNMSLLAIGTYTGETILRLERSKTNQVYILTEVKKLSKSEVSRLGMYGYSEYPQDPVQNKLVLTTNSSDHFREVYQSASHTVIKTPVSRNLIEIFPHNPYLLSTDVFYRDWPVVRGGVNQSIEGIRSSITEVLPILPDDISEGKLILRNNKYYPVIRDLSKLPKIGFSSLLKNQPSVSSSHAIQLDDPGTPNGGMTCYGKNTNLAYSSDGNIEFNPDGTHIPLPDFNNVSKVVAGEDCTYFLYKNGKVTVRGSNESYRLGTGDDIDVTVSTNKEILTFRNDWADIQSGGRYGLAVTKNGHVFTWGVESPYNCKGRHDEALKYPTLLPFVFTNPIVYAGDDCIYIGNADGMVYAIGRIPVIPGSITTVTTDVPILISDSRLNTPTGLISKDTGVRIGRNVINGLYGYQKSMKSNKSKVLYSDREIVTMLPIGDSPTRLIPEITNIFKKYNMYIPIHDQCKISLKILNYGPSTLFSLGEYGTKGSFEVVATTDDKVEIYTPIGSLTPHKVIDNLYMILDGFTTIQFNNDQTVSIRIPGIPEVKLESIKLNSYTTDKPLIVPFTGGTDVLDESDMFTESLISLPMVFHVSMTEGHDRWYPYKGPDEMVFNPWYNRRTELIQDFQTGGDAPLGYTVKFTEINVSFLDDLKLPYPHDYEKKENIEYLREKVDLFRFKNSLNPYEWTDEIIVSKVTPIRASHINELDKAIREVYNKYEDIEWLNEVLNQFNNPVVALNRAYQVKGILNRMHVVIRALQNK